MLHGQDVVSTDAGRFQCEVNLGIYLDGLLDRSNLFQHLFTAFGAFDGFFTVEGTQLLDYGFMMFDFLLLVKIFLEPGVHKPALFLGVIAVIAKIGRQSSHLDLQNLCDDPIQEIPVVGYDQHGA